ncbi:hypothetical protein HDU96_002139 [Phlyctochytrium bullatum]|nr:hypothetical protein HDU96_002139 [Phlyctochytrium bullatum]
MGTTQSKSSKDSKSSEAPAPQAQTGKLGALAPKSSSSSRDQLSEKASLAQSPSGSNPSLYGSTQTLGKNNAHDPEASYQRSQQHQHQQQAAQQPAAAAASSTASAGSGSMSGSGTLLLRVVEARGLSLPYGLSGNVRSDDPRLPYVVIEFDKNEAICTAKEWDREEALLGFHYRGNFDVCRESEVHISVYQRNPEGGHDILVGTAWFQPQLTDQNLQDDWININPSLESQNFNSNARSNNQPAGTIHVQASFKAKAGVKAKPLSMEDFELLKVIGKGSFGKVMQVRKKDTNRIYAMKIIKKSHIVERAEVSHTLAERMVLAKINHPFIVPLKFSFQNPEKLYLVLAFVNGGELFHHLQQEGRFEESRARFYTAELLCALECLHSFDIIYRDLKPENILLDFSGHIALCDFGLCKLNMKEGNKTNTFCGTPEYLAPEVLIGQGYTKAVDWWTLGILLYEMLTGLPPFYDENVNEMYKKILKDELRFPEDVGATAKDLLKGLLNRDPNQRLGSKNASEIKNHPFFAEIDWQRLMARKYTPPFRPNVASATDTSNFDEEFTSEAPQDSYAEGGASCLTDAIQNQFEGFSFRQEAAVAGSLMGANARYGASLASSLAQGSFRQVPGSLRR